MEMVQKSEKTNLNIKQETFCQYYTAIGTETWGHGTKSAIAAKYSEKTAYAQASRLLKSVKIKARIAEIKAELFASLNITRESTVMEYAHDQQKAREAGQWRVSADITTKLAEMAGFLKPKVEAYEPVVMSDDERRASEKAAAEYKLHLASTG